VECYFSPDETILDPSSGLCSHLYFIRQGSVTVTKPNAQDEQSARQLEAGDLFPVAAAVAARAVTSIYQSEGDTFCLRITVEQMNALIQSSPVLADFLNQRIQTFLEISRQSITTSYASKVFVQHALEAELRTLPEKDVLIVDASTPLRHALQEMKDLHVGSVLIGDAHWRGQGDFDPLRHPGPCDIATGVTRYAYPSGDVFASPDIDR